ncbi:MAG: hypothetical protein HZB53_11590 [Chloroflexi bacterium]|nr:hypothetical protein [Chloroflexota bacterium]
MQKVLVDIHGAGKQMSNFHDEARAALSKIMGATPVSVPAWYADLSNIGSPVYGDDDAGLAPGAVEFRREFRQAIRDQRAATDAAQPAAGAEYGFAENALFVADLVADVTRYLYDAGLQPKVQQRLIDALDKAAALGDAIVLVSHSLGTVVAYDVLRQGASRWKVAEFITMGSPLWKVVKAGGARAADTGQIAVPAVPRWRNFYDTSDPVANAIGPAFPGYRVEDVYFEIAREPVASHDYWHNAEVLTTLAAALR